MSQFTELSAAEIKSLQNLSKGWEAVWERISIELLSSAGIVTEDGKNGESFDVVSQGRLYIAARNAARFYGNPCIHDADFDDFVCYVYEQYYEKVKNKTLFLSYDYEQYGGDVFRFLCNPTIIRRMFARHFRTGTIIRTPYTKNVKPQAVKYDEPLVGKNGEETSFLETIPDRKGQDDDELHPLATLGSDKWELTIKPTAEGTFYSKDIHAGLQLYQRIDYGHRTMLRLQEGVHVVVKKADKFDKEPQKKIEKEHEAARKRIETVINALNDKVFDLAKQKVRNVSPELEQDTKRKIAKKRLEEIYRPLNTEQVADLLDVKRSAADQTMKRYYEYVTEILPLSEEAKEQFRPLFLQVFQNEKGEDDE